MTKMRKMRMGEWANGRVGFVRPIIPSNVFLLIKVLVCTHMYYCRENHARLVQEPFHTIADEIAVESGSAWKAFGTMNSSSMRNDVRRMIASMMFQNLFL